MVGLPPLSRRGPRPARPRPAPGGPGTTMRGGAAATSRSSAENASPSSREGTSGRIVASASWELIARR